MSDAPALARIRSYLADVATQWKTGEATEHSYRAALAALLADLIPRVTVVNEPAHIACGAPDLLVRSNGPTRAPVGYVETKDIGDGDLDGNGRNREQFDRYKCDLDNLVFTDYLDFRFHLSTDPEPCGNGERAEEEGVAAVRIAEVVGGRIVPAPDGTLERFAALIAHFGAATPRRITSPARLAALMAGKARLLARAISATLAADPDGTSPLAQQRETFRKMLIHDLTSESFADIYAQTITYGLFAARLHDATPEDFSRFEAATLLPRTNPLLRKMFLDLASDLDPSVEWINDDYVKFLRLAEHYVERNGQGIVAFINPHGFLDNPTFRGMRWNLLKTFDEIYVLNLHGNAKKKETCPDGSKDENVFDIMQGVSINIFVKSHTEARSHGDRGRGTRPACPSGDDGHAGRVTLPGESSTRSPSLHDQDNLRASVSPCENPDATECVPPEDIFHYVYAVLHTPSYRARYREFLKVDFPRIPYPATAAEFRQLAAIGAELVQVHLLKSPAVRQTFSPVATFPVTGDNRVENVTFQDGGHAGRVTLPNTDLRGSMPPCEKTGRVYINASQYFDNVPETAWSFFIGGYQPAQKWLKDRKGRVLTYDDAIHYKFLILALLETARLMSEL